MTFSLKNISALNSLMDELASTRRIFHSEMDFQHALAWALHLKDAAAMIRLEMPMNEKEHLDLQVQSGDRATRIAFELKYRTRKLDVQEPSELFKVKEHSARDHGRYDFIKDIQRLETYLRNEGSKGTTHGFAIFLTNDKGFWETPSKDWENTKDVEFRIHEGRTLVPGSLIWVNGPRDGTTKNRTAPIILHQEYLLKWAPYPSQMSPKGVKNGEFKFLAVHVKA